MMMFKRLRVSRGGGGEGIETQMENMTINIGGVARLRVRDLHF